MNAAVPFPHKVVQNEVTEESLLVQLAYYRAMLADANRAPRNSRHHMNAERIRSHLEECERRLAALQCK